jgi:predicted esterase
LRTTSLQIIAQKTIISVQAHVALPSMEEHTIAKHSIPITRTARYFTLNPITEDTRNIWVVFHGYGQLGEYFIRHFRQLDPKTNAIIALEGLSRFYVDGLGGRVGASWMTSEDREDEIIDQSNYINDVLRHAGIDPSAEKRLVVLGFSQGTATALRWMASNSIAAKQLILWAGQLPHDVASEKLQALLSNTKVDFCIGTEDEFISNVQVDERMEQLRKLLPQLQVHWFEGKHVMHVETLLHIASTI